MLLCWKPAAAPGTRLHLDWLRAEKVAVALNTGGKNKEARWCPVGCLVAEAGTLHAGGLCIVAPVQIRTSLPIVAAAVDHETAGSMDVHRALGLEGG